MAKYLILFFSICGFASMWGMYNVANASKLCLASLVLCLIGTALACSEWENQIKKKIK